jgi:hypothetical protein
MATVMETKIIRDLPNAEYRRAEGISNSLLRYLHQSYAHYEMAMAGAFPSTNEQIFGIAAHLAVFQPELMETEVLRGPADRYGNKWKDFVAENPGKICLPAKEFDILPRIREAVFGFETARNLLQEGEPEISYFWRDAVTEVPCKCRPDWRRGDGILIDLKTCAEGKAEAEEFNKYILNFRYFVQAAFYLDGVNEVDTDTRFDTFLFIAVEKVEPYLVAVHAVGEEWLNLGRGEYRADLMKLKLHQNHPERNKGYSYEIKELTPPHWVKQRYMEGEVI